MSIRLPTASISGYFCLVATDVETGAKRVVAPWQPNLILDAGLNRIGQGAFISGAGVGTGTTTPAVGQTDLVAQVAWSTTVSGSASNTNSGSSPYYNSYTVTYRFSAGTFSGEALAEVGVGWSTTEKFSRALIKDSGGSPTTVTVLASEILDVIYTLQTNIPETDTAFSITLDSISYSGDVRAANATSTNAAGSGWGLSPTNRILGHQCRVYDGAMGAITSEPSGTMTSKTSSDDAYVSGTYEKTFSATFDDTEANYDISAIRFGFSNLGCCFQADFSPVIPKSGKILTLELKATWARA